MNGYKVTILRSEKLELEVPYHYVTFGDGMLLSEMSTITMYHPEAGQAVADAITNLLAFAAVQGVDFDPIQTSIKVERL